MAGLSVSSHVLLLIVTGRGVTSATSQMHVTSMWLHLARLVSALLLMGSFSLTGTIVEQWELC